MGVGAAVVVVAEGSVATGGVETAVAVSITGTDEDVAVASPELDEQAAAAIAKIAAKVRAVNRFNMSLAG